MTSAISQQPPPDYPKIDFQWRSRQSGPWITFGQVGTMNVPGCAGAGFTGLGPNRAASGYQAQYPGGYYRAYFPGDSTYAPATSASTGRVWIYPIRFRSFRANSRSVAAGGKVRISGTLQYYNGKWRNYARTRVAIIFALTRNAKSWYEPPGGSVQTNSKGAFAKAFTDTYMTGRAGSQFWSANYDGNETHLAVSAGQIGVKVHGHGSSKPSRLPARSVGPVRTG